MLNLATGDSHLEILLRDAGGVVVSAVLGTAAGEVRAATADAAPGDDVAAVAASFIHQLAAIGELLGLGVFSLATSKGETTARIFAVQADAALVLTVDGRRPLGELESKLRTSAWRPREIATPPPLPMTAAGSSVSARPTPARSGMRAAIPLPAGSTRPSLRTGAAEVELAPARQRAAVITRPRPVAAEGSGRVEKAPGEAAFAGELGELALPDLLEFMRHGIRTGALTCTSGARVGWVHLSRGFIIAADSPGAGDLREHLLANARITAAQRRLITAMPSDCFAEDAADLALVSQGVVSREELMEARVSRVYSAFREMITWSSGRFSFDPAAPIMSQSQLQLTAQSVFLTIFQEQDELGR